jgi:hypothetical protein
VDIVATWGFLLIEGVAKLLSSDSYLLSPVNGRDGGAALLLAVDLGPDGEHDVAEDKGIQGDEGDVAAEVEGEDGADEEEEHAAGFLIHWFSQPSSSFGAASRQSFFDLPQGLDSPLRSCRARIATARPWNSPTCTQTATLTHYSTRARAPSRTRRRARRRTARNSPPPAARL